MNLQTLCTNCMLGTTEHQICPFCGKTADWETSRPVIALPAHYMLGEQYVLGKVLGCGGFGITYLAWDVRNRRRVAVKELFPNKDVTRERGSGTVSIVSGQEDYVAHIRQRFLEEAQSLFAFSQEPDVINVYRLFEENGTAYYAMEYLEGMDLKHLLVTQGRMSWEQLSVYLRMVLHSLRALHRENMIHRDISPDNIFITKDHRAKLIDFGSLRSYNNSNGLTTILKHNFAPYEQYRSNGNQGPWTDIYSLSVTMYYALAGVLPPKAPDRILSDKTVPIQQHCPELPGYVAAAIMKGMAIQPEERFQTVDAFASALGLGLDSAPSPSISHLEGQVHYLKCIRGVYHGRQWPLQTGTSLLMGRDRNCQIPYPPNAQGISRRQCTVIYDRQAKLWVRDEHSSYGTSVNQMQLKPGQWYVVQPGVIITFAQEQYQII